MGALTGPAIAGGLAVLAGVALWQLGIELERAWLRSYDGPLLGETPAEDRGGGAQSPQTGHADTTVGVHRRWVSGHRRSATPTVARVG